MHHPTAFVTPVVEHWLEREISKVGCICSITPTEHTDKIIIGYGMSKIWVVGLSSLRRLSLQVFITRDLIIVNRQDSTYYDI